MTLVSCDLMKTFHCVRRRVAAMSTQGLAIGRCFRKGHEDGLAMRAARGTRPVIDSVRHGASCRVCQVRTGSAPERVTTLGWPSVSLVTGPVVVAVRFSGSCVPRRVKTLGLSSAPFSGLSRSTIVEE